MLYISQLYFGGHFFFGGNRSTRRKLTICRKYIEINYIVLSVVMEMLFGLKTN